MFTSLLLQNNPELVDYSLFLHQHKLIEPDTYILDSDSILSNYQLISEKAQRLGMETFVMTKQVGRHPILITMLSHMKAQFVAVDYREAQKIISLGAPLAHVGHLVQIPFGLIPSILSTRPQYVTVYSIEQAQEINKYAHSEGFVQKILLRTIQKPYEGQDSQIYSPDELLGFARKIQNLPNITLAGLTSFPCFLYDSHKKQVIATENADYLQEMFALLSREYSTVTVKNMPSHNNYSSLSLIASLGATQIEPGHALTGTCPHHAVSPNPHEEKIALAYLSEISHHADQISYCYGGGYYRRSHWEHCYSPVLKNNFGMLPLSPTAIDYTLGIQGVIPIGSPIIASFRTQIFVTRSQVALVGGLSTGSPKLLGIADAQGNTIS